MLYTETQPDISPDRNKLSAWRTRANELASAVERHHFIIVAALAILYAIYIWHPAHLILWHDEMFTYYIAKSPNFHKFIEEVRLLDMNPPLDYALTRVSQDLFGDSPFANRVPSILAFFLASIAFMYFLARRTGMLWGALAVLIVWYGPYFRFATQARGYAVLVAFFALTLLCWDSVLRGRHRQLALAGIFIGNTGMMLTHVFGCLSIMPFCVAEIVRWYRTRKTDWALWACLLLPLVWVLSYIPLIQRFEAEAFPAQFQGGIRKTGAFYTKRVIADVCPGVLLALVAALAVSPFFRSRSPQETAEPQRTGFTIAHAALFVGLMLPPILINLALMHTHGAFWDRYCITTAIGIYLAIGLFIGYQVKFSRLAALASIAVLVPFTIADTVVIPWEQERAARAVTSHTPISQLRPDLPFVVASGLTFIALDHHENGDFLKRVYYLTDRPSALHYTHATIFEGMAVENPYFHFRGHIVPYYRFIAQHPHFLVLGTMYYEEDWLLRKLKDDGAELNYMGEYNTPYKDWGMYDVVMPASAVAKAAQIASAQPHS